MPTASAVVGDIIEIGRNLQYQSNARIGCTCYETKTFLGIQELQAKYYIRMMVKTVLEYWLVLPVFLKQQCQHSQCITKTSEADMAELILITHKVREQVCRILNSF